MYSDDDTAGERFKNNIIYRLFVCPKTIEVLEQHESRVQ